MDQQQVFDAERCYRIILGLLLRHLETKSNPES